MSATIDYTKTGGTPATEFSNLSSANLKKWRAALAGAQSGAGSAKVAFIGDSTDVGFWASGTAYTGNRALSIPDAVARLFQGAGISSNVANQFGSSGVPTANLASFDPRWTFGAGWAASGAGGVPGRFLLTNTSDTTTASFTPKKPDGTALSFDTIKLTYLKQSIYANFTIGVDGGAALFTSAQAGTGALDVASVTVPLGTHTVNIAKIVADAAKQFFIASIWCYDSTASQVHCLNLAGGSMAIADMANSTNYYSSVNQISLLAPHLSVINCTINDALGLTDLATYRSQMQTLINTCAASGSVILRTGNPVQTGYSGFVADTDEPYISVMSDLARSNNLPFLNTKRRLVSYTDANSLGFMVDGAHPTKVGYADIANAVYTLMRS